MYRILFLTLMVSFRFTVAAQVVNIPEPKQLPDSVFLHMQNYKAILLGEIHGTKECAELAEGFAKLWTAHQRSVLLGLEIPASNQRYIDSLFTTQDTTFIDTMPFFMYKDNNDGRSSKAMYELLKRCITIPNLKVLCYDTDEQVKTNAERDSLMAEHVIMSLKDDTSRTFISLSGNLHAAVSSNKGYYTMGEWLARNNLFSPTTLASINIKCAMGTAWFCMGTTQGVTCGAQDVSSQSTLALFSAGIENFLTLGENVQSGKKFTGTVYCRQCNASSPVNE